MKAFWRAVLLIIFILLAAVVVAPLSGWGSRALLAAADLFTPLRIEYAGGSLAGELHLHSVALETEALRLRVEDLAAELEPACLLRSTFCFRRLEAGSFSLDILPTVEEQAPEGAAPATGMIHFPVGVEAGDLVVGSARVVWAGGQWSQGAMRAAVVLGGHTVAVPEAHITDPRLELQGGDGDSPKTGAIEMPSVRLPLEIVVDDLTLERPGWRIQEEGSLESLQLAARWRKSHLEIRRLGVAGGEWGSGVARGSIRFRDDWPLSLAADLEIPVSALQHPQVSVEATGSLAALQLDADLKGERALSLRGTLDALQRELPFSAELEGRWSGRLPLSELGVSEGVLDGVELSSPLLLKVRGSLESQHFDLNGIADGLGYEEMGVRLSGFRQAQRIQVDQLILRDATGGNDLQAVGEVTTGPAVSWEISLQSKGIDLPQLSGYARGRVKGSLQVAGEAGRGEWRVAVSGADLSGEVNGLPAVLTGHGGIAGGLRFGPSDLRGELNGARFLLRSTDDTGGAAHLDLSIDDLGRWRPGSRGRLELEADMARETAELSLWGTLVDVQSGAMDLERGRVSGSYRPGENQAFRLELDLSSLSVAGVEFSSLALRASGDAAGQELSLLAGGDLEGRLELVGAPDGDGWSGLIKPTNLRAPGGNWNLSDAIPLHWGASGGGLAVAAHCWRTVETRLCPGELVLSKQGRAGLQVEGDMQFLAGLFPREVEVQGNLDLQLDAAWSPGEPLSLRGNAVSREVRITRDFGAGEYATVTWDRAEASVEPLEEGLQMAAEVHRDGRRILSLSLLLPPGSGQLAGALGFEDMQLETLAPFLPDFAALEGALRGELQLGGSLRAPRGSGTVALSNGRVALLGNPTQLESLELSLELQGDRAAVSGSGMLGAGPVRLEGQWLLAPELRLELDLAGENGRLLLPPASDLLLSQTLHLVATAGEVNVSGDVTVQEGRVRGETLPAEGVALSRDVVVVDYAGNVLHAERPFDTVIDVWIHIRDRLEVGGRGLRATVGGDLHLTGDRGQPLQLFGSLNVIGGELVAYRQRLEIRRGTIGFSGTPQNPEFAVRAERHIRSDDVTVGVELQGTLEDPSMSVYSNPVMEESEAMSYLVRGRGLDVGAEVDGTALALSLGTDVVNSSGVLAELDRLPGISQVQLSAEGSEDDASAAVGGYVGDRVYLSYGIGIYEPITVLTARLYLNARLWLEVVSRLENSLDLYYAFDID